MYEGVAPSPRRRADSVVTTKHKTYPKLPLYGLRLRRGVRIEASTRLPGPRSRVTSATRVHGRVPPCGVGSLRRPWPARAVRTAGGRRGCGLGACGLAALALHCPTCASVDTSLQSTVPSCTASCPLRHNRSVNRSVHSPRSDITGPSPRERSVDVRATSRVATSTGPAQQQAA